MEQRNNKQDLIIFEIENLLNKMSNQVIFLIRKEMTMNQLDVDLLMENTRKLYDTICSIELGVDVDSDSDVDSDTDFDADTDADSELIDSSTDRLIDSDANSDADSELIDSSTDGLIDSDKEEDSVPSPITNIYSAQTEEVSGIRTYKIVRENAPTISDKLEQSVDNSIAARMQRKPVSDLISAIDINDKFLFLNELFGGSMDKYNKSIRSLNSFSTLLGAKTYMSELQIEFQWDCNSDAYKKLADLVERRFI